MLILIVLLLVLALGGLPQVYPHDYGYLPSSTLGVVLIVILILLWLHRI